MKTQVSFWVGMVVLLATVNHFSSCKKDQSANTEDDLFFVEFVIDGDTVRYEDGLASYGNGPGVSSYQDSTGRLHGQFSTFIRSELTPNYEDNVLTIQMVKFFSDTNFPTYNTDFLMFDEGFYQYGSWNGDSTILGIDGVVVKYTDNDGKPWSSDRLFGQQDGSATFEITFHNAVDQQQFGARTRGTFKCRVFDGQGASLDLNAGRFHARTIL